jgi:hypothetical protein
MSAIKVRVQEDIKNAMRAKDQALLGILRLISAAVKQKEVDERIELTDEHMLAVLDKMAKQRRESITQFHAANRSDLVAKETYELSVIEQYLPQQLTSAEIDALIVQAIAETSAVSIKDMAKVMAVIKPKAQGRADMAAISQKIKDRLAAL